MPLGWTTGLLPVTLVLRRLLPLLFPLQLLPPPVLLNRESRFVVKIAVPFQGLDFFTEKPFHAFLMWLPERPEQAGGDQDRDIASLIAEELGNRFAGDSVR